MGKFLRKFTSLASQQLVFPEAMDLVDCLKDGSYWNTHCPFKLILPGASIPDMKKELSGYFLLLFPQPLLLLDLVSGHVQRVLHAVTGAGLVFCALPDS